VLGVRREGVTVATGSAQKAGCKSCTGVRGFGLRAPQRRETAVGPLSLSSRLKFALGFAHRGPDGHRC
jgi:hypothetical protein